MGRGSTPSSLELVRRRNGVARFLRKLGDLDWEEEEVPVPAAAGSSAAGLWRGPRLRPEEEGPVLATTGGSSTTLLRVLRTPGGFGGTREHATCLSVHETQRTPDMLGSVKQSLLFFVHSSHWKKVSGRGQERSHERTLGSLVFNPSSVARASSTGALGFDRMTGRTGAGAGAG